jgi:hypothetical protein
MEKHEVNPALLSKLEADIDHALYKFNSLSQNENQSAFYQYDLPKKNADKADSRDNLKQGRKHPLTLVETSKEHAGRDSSAANQKPANTGSSAIARKRKPRTEQKKKQNMNLGKSASKPEGRDKEAEKQYDSSNRAIQHLNFEKMYVL